MRRPCAREVGALSARFERTRRAYGALITDQDPAAGWFGALDVVDLRPDGGTDGTDGWAGIAGGAVVSGPRDLIELRAVVESVTGIGTWPVPEHPLASSSPIARGALERPPRDAMIRLVASMDGWLDDRGAMWRTQRTMLDVIAAALDRAALTMVTLEAVLYRADH